MAILRSKNKNTDVFIFLAWMCLFKPGIVVYDKIVYLQIKDDTLTQR